MRKPYLLRPSLSDMDEAKWSQVHGLYLSMADSFSAYFPDDPELNAGKDDFIRLPGVSVSTWDGMKDCQQVSGPLTPEAVAFLAQAQGNVSYRLWKSELLQQGQLLLSIEDFWVCIISATDSELAALTAQGVNIDAFMPIELNPTSSIEGVPAKEDELGELRELLSTELLSTDETES